MELEKDNTEELLLRVIEALPRLKKYRLSEPQKAFIEKIEKMAGVAQRQVKQQNLQVV